ncbi:helix-turn-helix transcriptional regulator [Marinomonas sp. THO17]|uniref:response regulator transcription factor n=1 Tax=Marinomonas sp. THO17 TaxID=3149048 RepID=UPI00336BFA18
MSTNQDNKTLSAEHLSAFSTCVFDFYQIARQVPCDEFQHVVLQRLSKLVNFSSAWWGRSNVLMDRPRYLHSAFLYALPDSYLDDWERIQQYDATIDRAFEQPEKAIFIDLANDTSISSELVALGKCHGFDQIACVMQFEELMLNTRHLSLYRKGDAFSTEELGLIENLMPHLILALEMNQIRSTYMSVLSANQRSPVALAVTSPEGLLQSAEPSFIQALRGEWPNWRGPRLPFSIELTKYRGNTLSIDIKHTEEHCLLLIRIHEMVERLSQRELDVARLFSSGRTYKEIASVLSLSPHTVRYYLRNIYSKLNVNGKADLVRLMVTKDALQ